MQHPTGTKIYYQVQTPERGKYHGQPQGKMLPPKQLPTPSQINTTVQRIGEDWVQINRNTTYVTIHIGQMNAVILPDTIKFKEYRRLMKGPEKLKCKRAMENNIVHLLQVIRDIEGTDTRFFIHRPEVPKDSKVTYILIVYDFRH